MLIIFDDKNIKKKKNALFKNNQLFNSNVGVYSIKWNVVFQWAHLILDWNYGLNYFFYFYFFNLYFVLHSQHCSLLFIFYVEGSFFSCF